MCICLKQLLHHPYINYIQSTVNGYLQNIYFNPKSISIMNAPIIQTATLSAIHKLGQLFKSTPLPSVSNIHCYTNPLSFVAT